MAKTIRIGHASTDTVGSAANEVLISTYSSSLAPTVVLRPKTLDLASKSANACEAGCNNNKIEYSQGSRNTLNIEAEKVGYKLENITNTCYADCSSFMTVCAIAGGSKLKYGSSAPNCGNMRARFTQSGDYIALTDSVYLTSSDYLQRGDILVRETYLNGNRHTVMILDNGSKVPEISISQDDPQIDLAKTAYTPVKVSLTLPDITTNKATIEARLTKIQNSKETDLSASALKTYEWSYLLEALDSSKTVTESIKVNSARSEFTIKNLLPSNSYRIKVTALEDDTDTVFSSPSVIFRTQQSPKAEARNIEFRDDTASASKCKIFIKIKDVFNRAVLYNKEV